MSWISVKDGLPNSAIAVFVYWRARMWPTIGFFSERQNKLVCFEESEESELITHWFPIPDPPEET